MVKIYVKTTNGQKVYVEVSEKQAQAYREELRKEWRSECYESYYTTSLDAIIDAGRDIEDKKSDINDLLEEREREFQKKYY